jgi:hypothetical protein
MDRADDLTGQHGAPRAARISYDSSTLPAMVAYVVDDNVDGLTTTTRFTSADIHKVMFPASTDEGIAIKQHQATSFGLIPVTDQHIAAAAEYEDRQQHFRR